MLKQPTERDLIEAERVSWMRECKSRVESVSEGDEEYVQSLGSQRNWKKLRVADGESGKKTGK